MHSQTTVWSPTDTSVQPSVSLLQQQQARQAGTIAQRRASAAAHPLLAPLTKRGGSPGHPCLVPEDAGGLDGRALVAQRLIRQPVTTDPQDRAARPQAYKTSADRGPDQPAPTVSS